MLTAEQFTKLAIACSGLMTIAYLGFGIAGVIIVSQNTGAKDECVPAIWYCVMVLCIIHFATFAGNTREILKRVCDHDREKEKSNGTVWDFMIVTTEIWACVTFYKTDEECVNTYRTLFPQLWTMLQADVILFFVGLCIVGMLCCCGCCTVCIMSQSQQQQQQQQQQQHQQPRVEITTC